mmetsp:Transcript_109692/g.340428  ORF Transcript_109692/g.340428 Transcript_109692/m.340428 type:complete len:298 (-) Transcript_109692:24-917(-)
MHFVALVELGGVPVLQSVEVAHDNDGRVRPLGPRLRVRGEGLGVPEVCFLVAAAEGVDAVDQKLLPRSPVPQHSPAQAAVPAEVLHAILQGLPEVLVVEDVAIPRLLLQLAAVAEGVVPAGLLAHPFQDARLLVPLLRDDSDVRPHLGDGLRDALHAPREAELRVVHVEGREPDRHVVGQRRGLRRRRRLRGRRPHWRPRGPRRPLQRRSRGPFGGPRQRRVHPRLQERDPRRAGRGPLAGRARAYRAGAVHAGAASRAGAVRYLADQHGRQACGRGARQDERLDRHGSWGAVGRAL